MRKQILAGAVAALMYSGAAVAGGGASADCADTHTKAQTEASLTSPESMSGSMAQAPASSDLSVDDRAAQQDPLVEDPASQQPIVNGNEGIGGSGSEDVGAGAYSTDTNTAAFTPVEEERNKESRSDMRGLTVVAGAGVEGYTFGLAPQVNPGAAWNVVAALKPTKVLGLELGYNGAANEIAASDTATVNGADIIRNGGQVVATVGLSAAPVQPYILGGIGVSRYNVRSNTPGFDDDTVGAVPVGAGLRTHIGNFTADARLGYNFLFDQEFAGNVATTDIGAPGDTTFSNGGSYTGTLNFGTTF